ncbi:hypothetical protein CDAR_8401 [Caerostris darwini]|uniref:Uncharacterized protein n=1 Tax=Caerostris darwini TaxID=1538125 RepID=A0AAV4WTW9_9ARAC|nr:hypothetical protein CDAR_8401 [Caerostris darwini]
MFYAQHEQQKSHVYFHVRYDVFQTITMGDAHESQQAVSQLNRSVTIKGHPPPSTPAILTHNWIINTPGEGVESFHNCMSICLQPCAKLDE